MPDRQRTADGEGEGTLGEGFLYEVVTLPRAIMALEPRVDGVGTSRAMSESGLTVVEADLLECLREYVHRKDLAGARCLRLRHPSRENTYRWT